MHFQPMNTSMLIKKQKKSFKDGKHGEASSIKYEKAIQKQANYILSKTDKNNIPIPKNKVKDVTLEVTYEKEQKAPIPQNQVIGKIEAKIENEVILSRNIQLEEELPKKQVWDYFRQFCYHYWQYMQQGMLKQKKISFKQGNFMENYKTVIFDGISLYFI